MARRGADGAIILETKIDESGIKKGTASIKDAVNKTGKACKNLGNTILQALEQGNTKAAQLANNYKKATEEVEKQKQKVAELKRELDGLESGDIKVQDKGVSKLQGDFDKATTNAQKLQNEINEIYMELDKLQMSAFKSPNTGDVVLTGKEEAEFARLNARLNELEPKLIETKQKAAEMGESLKKAVGTATQSEIDKTKAKLSEAENKLGDLSTKAEIAGKKLENNMSSSGDKVSFVGDGLDKMGKRLLRLASGALIFSAITKGLTALRDMAGKVLMSNEEFRGSLMRLQAALWTAFTPIINYIVPAIRTLVNWITSGIIAITKFVVTLTGKSYSSMTENAKNLKDQADAYEKISSGSSGAAKGIKKATAEAKKQLAVFDDLSILSENKSEQDADELAGAGGAEGNIFGGAIDPGEYSTKLAEIGMVTGAALVGLGIILLFNGQFVLGIGAIAGGLVVGTGAMEGAQNLGEEEKQKLMRIGAITGAALIGLGVLLLFTSKWSLGLGMIASGAMAIYEALVLGEFSQDVKQKVTDILLLTGTVLLVLGTILLFVPGAEGVGLKMLAMGAAELFAAAVVNANEIIKWIRENAWLVLGEIAKFIFFIGVILLFVPGMMNWGIAAMVSGIAILGISAIVPNWDEIKTTVKNFFTDNKDAIAQLGAGLLILGILLLFVPGMWGFGLALIVAGIGSLAILWMSLDDLDIKGKVKVLLNGLIGLFEGFLNFLTSGIRSFANDAIGILNTIGDAIGIEWDIPTLSEIKLPRLAQGAVIPPNREFMAVLGDQKHGVNIETPLQTMIDAFNAALDNRNGSSGGSTTVVLEIDGREFGRAVVEQGDKEKRRIGTRMVMA